MEDNAFISSIVKSVSSLGGLLPRSVAKKILPDELETAIVGPTAAQRQAGVTRLSALESFATGRDTTGGSEPPGSEGGSVRGDVVDQPPGSRDLLEQPTTNVINIPYGGEFMAQQQPMQAGVPMLGSPMVYNRVAQIARRSRRDWRPCYRSRRRWSCRFTF